MAIRLKDVFAVLLALGGLIIGVSLMLPAESGVVVNPEQANDLQGRLQMLASLKVYFQGIGAAFVLAAIAYMLIGQEEEISTVFPPSQKKS